MNWNQRLTIARKARNMNKLTLAKLVGISAPTATHWESGQIARIDAENLMKVCSVLKINPAWLMNGSEPMDVGINQELASYESQNTESGPTFKSQREYPVISWVQAGEWTGLCDNFQPGHAEEWRPCHIDLGECGYVLRVKGDSMTAPEGLSFPDGMLLYVDPDAEPLPGKFVIVRRSTTDEATFKRLTKIEGELYLEAINPRWPTPYMKLEQGDQFCGVVRHAGFDMP